MTMRTSLAGAMDIIAHEAIVLTPYRDSKGVWTIGVGHTAAAGPPNPATFKGALTVKEAFDLFRRDLASFERRVNKAFTAPLRQHEFDAAVSFDFNTGGIDQANWVRLFNQGRREEAVAAIMNWSKPPEIIPRRRKEQRLFATGLYSGDGLAMLYPAMPDGRVAWSRGRRIDLAAAYGGIPAKPPQLPAGPPPPAPKKGGRLAIIGLAAAIAAAAAALFFGVN